MAADSSVEWTRDLGDGRLLVMERDGEHQRASLAGFRGVGSSQEAALDDLLGRMQDHIDVSVDFARSFAPGGELDSKLQQIRQLVDQNAADACACYGCTIQRLRAGIPEPDRSTEPCDPPDACAKDGRCLMHSEWLDEARPT